MQHLILEALRMTGIMAWTILWALCLGVLLSGILEAVLSKEQLSKLLPDPSPTILIASGIGAARSSCSYALSSLHHQPDRAGSPSSKSIPAQVP